MSLLSLQVNHLRNLSEISLDFSSKINLLYGDNGSGKTSVLEAIHLLAMARSFRATQINQAITHGSEATLINGQVQTLGSSYPLGLKLLKTRSARPECFIGEQPASSVAELAQALPVQLLNLDGYQLLRGAPDVRRKFVDWMMFHVEHSFFGLWQDFNRVLRQRNAVLKGFAERGQLMYWTEKLGELGQGLHDLRFQAINDWEAYSREVLAEAPGVGELSIRYEPGWDTQASYKDQLNQCIDQDLEYGYTSLGPHRSDIKISLGTSLAKNILSTGQGKTFVSMLQLTQCKWVSEKTGKIPILLVDDLPSELDANSRKWLMKQLVSSGAQIFLTSVEKNSFDNEFLKDGHKMFHVEHGIIRDLA